MSTVPLHTGFEKARLRAEIDRIKACLLRFEQAASEANEPRLIDAFRAPLEIGYLFVDLHGAHATGTIADDSMSLRSVFSRPSIPRATDRVDPLERLHTARGELSTAIGDLIAAAARAGFWPSTSTMRAPKVAEFERAGLSSLLAALDGRLAQVASRLESLRPVGLPDPNEATQETELVNFFVDNLALEIAFARFEVEAGVEIDFATLIRAVEAMAELTGNFIATVRAMGDSATPGFGPAAEKFRPLVGRVASGLVAIISKIHRTLAHAAEGEAPRLSPRPGRRLNNDERKTLEKLRSHFACSEQIALEFLEAGQILRYRDGQSILSEGERARSAYLMISGRAHALLYSVEGQIVLLCEYVSGDLFGALGELDPAPEEAEVVAVGDVVVFMLSSATLVSFAETYGSIGIALSRMLLRQLRRATSRIYERAAISAVGRVHAEILRLARADENMKIVNPNLAELAVRVSTTRETVSRALSSLERKGIVRRDSNSMIVVSPAHLEQLII